MTDISDADLLAALTGEHVGAPAPADGGAPDIGALEQHYGIPAGLYGKLLTAGEASGDKSVSPKGAIGRAQLMPDTAKALGVDPNDPAQNVEGGARYFSSLYKQFGNWKLAAAAYDAGPAAVLAHNGVPPFPETQGYVDRIFGSQTAGPSDEELLGALTSGATPAPAGDAVNLQKTPVQYSNALGFQKGLMTPIDNLAHWANKLINLDGVSRALGMPTTDEANAAHKNYLIDQEAQGVRPGMIGELAGGLVAGAPLTVAGAGPIAAGATLGALSTEHPDQPMEVAKDATVGAIGGKLGDLGISAAKNVISPILKPAINKLISAGVDLTPGQLAGGFTKSMEDKLTSLPIAGDMINAARMRSLVSFNRAATNAALEPIGEQLSPGLVGREAIAEAQQKLSGAYSKALTGSTLHVDQGLVDDLINEVRPRMLDLAPDRQEQLRSILMNRLGARFKGNTISDVDLNRVDGELGNLARNNSSSGDADQRGLGDALEATQDALRDMIERQNPAAAAKLSAARRGYAMLTRVERAAASPGAEGGVFTAPQLSAAVRSADSSVRKRGFAAGNALMQDLSDAGKEVLPSKIPDSGTPGRMFANMLFTGAGLEGAHVAHVLPQLLAGGTVGAGIYSKAGNRLIQSAMTDRPAFAPYVANKLEMMRTPVTLSAALAARNAYAQDGNADSGDSVIAIMGDGTRVLNRKDASGNYIRLPPAQGPAQ